jgi:hypothetical protein
VVLGTTRAHTGAQTDSSADQFRRLIEEEEERLGVNPDVIYVLPAEAPLRKS